MSYEKGTFQKINLGDEVEDKVTGFKGIVTARVHYVEGTIEFGVAPKAEENRYPKVEYFDATRLLKVSDGMNHRKDRP